MAENPDIITTWTQTRVNMTTTEQLGDISMIMADGYHFANLRFLLESMQEDDNKEQIKKIITQFYNLCKYAEKL